MKLSYILFSILFFAFFACSEESEQKAGNLQSPKFETPVEQETQVVEVPETEPEPVEIPYEEQIALLEKEEKPEFDKLLQKDNPNIMDYYLAIPYSYVFAYDCQDPEFMTMEYRKRGIHYQNLKAGYLKHSKHSDGQVFVLFKNRSENKDYIAHIRENQCGDFSCGADQGFVTLDESGKWVNVTDQLLGHDELTAKIWKGKGMDYRLKLPEKGTSIEILRCWGDTEVEEGLGKLVWKQTHFTAELNEAGKAYFK